MNEEFKSAGTATATGSLSSITPSEKEVIDDIARANPAQIQTDHHATSIAIADHVVLSRSAESVGVVTDSPRPCRARASRLGTPSPGRRGGAGVGGVKRHASSGSSPQVKSAISRKSKSGTAQSEKLRLDYTFEKPDFSNDIFPSMYEELLRTFEEEDNPQLDTSASVNKELALVMSGMLSDDDDEDDAEMMLPGKLLYSIFADRLQRRPPRPSSLPHLDKISSATAEANSLKLTPGTLKMSESDGVSNTSSLNFTESDILLRPRQPSPPEDVTSSTVSEINVLPSTSASLNCPELKAPQKQIYVSYKPIQPQFYSEVMKNSLLIASETTKDVKKDEKLFKSTSFFDSSSQKQKELNKKKGLENEQKSDNEITKETDRPSFLPDSTKSLLKMIPETTKEHNQTKSCCEFKTDVISENILDINDETIPNKAADKQSPPLCSESSGDRIRSDKRIPLPEEILMAINRAIELGKLRAKGDSDVIKTSPVGRGSYSLPEEQGMFPSKSSIFPKGERASLPAQRPFSYFKISSSRLKVGSSKYLSDSKLHDVCEDINLGTDKSANHTRSQPSLLIPKRSVGSSPLYMKSFDNSREQGVKAALECESINEPLSTPPNTPTRSKAGITFSNPIATCVTDCNTNMTGSGSSSNITGLPLKSGKISAKKPQDGPNSAGEEYNVKTEVVKKFDRPTAKEFGEKEFAALKINNIFETAYKPTPAPLKRNPKNTFSKTTLNSHPSILLKPQEYLDFYTFLRNKTPVKKEVRKPKTKIFQLQRMMTDPLHELGTRSVSPDPEDFEMDSKPIFPQGREAPPGWKPGEHGSHPITQISAEYELAALASSKTKKNAWKRGKGRRKGLRSRDNRVLLKQSASDVSSEMATVQSSQRASQDSSDDMAVVTKTEFERNRHHYGQSSRLRKDDYAGQSGKRNISKKVTEQVKFLKTIDDICIAEEAEYSEDDMSLPLEGFGENVPRYQRTDKNLSSSLEKYYMKQMATSFPKSDPSQAESGTVSTRGVRIARSNMQVPSAMSQERLRALCPTSPQGASGQSSKWLRRANHSHPNLPLSSAKWPESSVDIANVQMYKKNPRKLHQNESEWISSSKIGVNSDYREAWEQLRANFVEAKNEQICNGKSCDQVKKDSKGNSEKPERSTSQKKTPAVKLIAGLKEKSKSFKLKQTPKLPAPSDRSEEDTWSYSVNAMLLKAKQVMADSQKKGTHRFPRNNSAAVVSPVIDQKANSSFLKTLLKQDAEELRMSKMTTLTNTEDGIRHQRDRIRNAVNKTTTGINSSKGKIENKSSNADFSLSKENFESDKNLVVLTIHGSSNAIQKSLPAGRIHKPLDVRLPGNRHNKTNQNQTASSRKPSRRTFGGSNYIVDQALHYYDYPYITENSIVPLFGNTNSNALSNCDVKSVTDTDFLGNNNNALPAFKKERPSNAPTAIKKSFLCSDSDRANGGRNSSSSNIYFCESMNQHAFFDSLFNLKKEIKFSKQKFISKEESLGVALSRAKEKADAAYMAFLDHTKQVSKVQQDEPVEAPNVIEKADESLMLEEIHENNSFRTSPIANTQTSKKVEIASSTESCYSDLLIKCENFNKAFAAKVPEKSIANKVKSGSYATRKGIGSLKSAYGTHKELPLVIIGAQKQIQSSKLSSSCKQKSFFKNFNQISSNHGAHKKMDIIYRNKSDTQDPSRSNKSVDKRRNVQLSKQENKHQLPKELAHLKPLKYTNLDKTILSAEFKRNLAMIKSANDTMHELTCESEQVDVAKSQGDQDAKAMKKSKSEKLSPQSYFNPKEESIINFQLRNHLESLDLECLVKECQEKVEVHDRREFIESLDTMLATKNNSKHKPYNLAQKKDLTFIRGSSLASTFEVSNSEETPEYLYFSKLFDKSLAYDHASNREQPGVCETDNYDDKCRDHGKDAKSLETDLRNKNTTNELEIVAICKEAEHSMKGKDEDEQQHKNGFLQNRQIYGDCQDPDYLCMSECDINDTENPLNVQSQLQIAGNFEDARETKYNQLSPRRSLSHSTVKLVPSKSSLPSELEIPVSKLSCEKREDICPVNSICSIGVINGSQVSSTVEGLDHEESFSSFAESYINNEQHVRATTGSCETSQRSRDVISVPFSNDDEISVLDVLSKVSADPPLPNCNFTQKNDSTSIQVDPSSQTMRTTAISTIESSDTLHRFHKLEDSQCVKASLYNSKREILSGRPPPPTPQESNTERLDEKSITIISHREQLLLGLKSAATTFFFVPVFILNKWQSRVTSSTVLKIYFCSEDSMSIRYSVDKEGYRLSKIPPLTVFYRLDSEGFPLSLYTVQWFGRGLYSLKNRDVISDNNHIKLVKLGSLLDHSLQSGSQPPRLEHYPLLLMGAPKATRKEALVEANRFHSTPTDKCEVATIVNLLLGVTPWWTIPGHQNQFLGPPILSSCITTAHYGADNNAHYNDLHLRDMIVKGADIPTIIKSFQNIAIPRLRNGPIAELTATCKTLENVRKKKQRPNSEMFWSVSAAGKTKPISNVRNEQQALFPETYRLPNIVWGTDHGVIGDFTCKSLKMSHKKPITDKTSGKSLFNNAACENGILELGVTGLRPAMTKRYNLPPVGSNASQALGLYGQNAGEVSVERYIPSSRLLGIVNKTSPGTTPKAKGGQMKGWEWSTAVLPPPFPNTLRRSNARRRIRRQIKKLSRGRLRGRTKSSKRKLRRRSSSSSLKSYSSGPSTRSSSEDESPTAKILMEQLSVDKQKPKTLLDIINKITRKSTTPYEVKQSLQVKKQREGRNAKEEKKIQDGTKTSRVSGLNATDSPIATPTPLSSRSGRVSAHSEYDMLSDVDEAKEVWANCFPKVHFSTKKQRWCHVKQNNNKRGEEYAKAAVMMGLGLL